MTTATPTLDERILDALRAAFVADLGDLRAKMPATHRGANFDAAILALADARQIVLAQDCLPESLTSAQLRSYIRCGAELYTVAMLAR